ncbi:MAG TPA: hypothetical protein VLR94_10480 [Acidobacteriota bacterium]|nr:hypothetical protein [Acidobacteriota bacterium]
MKRVLAAALYWTYERGSWQWDVMVLCFLLVIFGTPRDFLESFSHRALAPDQIRSIILSFWR